MVIFWDTEPCRLVDKADVSERLTASTINYLHIRRCENFKSHIYW
jgi:hypothetical protein